MIYVAMNVFRELMEREDSYSFLKDIERWHEKENNDKDYLRYIIVRAYKKKYSIENMNRLWYSYKHFNCIKRYLEFDGVTSICDTRITCVVCQRETIKNILVSAGVQLK